MADTLNFIVVSSVFLTGQIKVFRPVMRGLLPLIPVLTLLAWEDLPSRRPFPGQTRVKLMIRTPQGKPTGLRLRVTDASGVYFAPLGHASIAESRRSAGDVLFGDGKTSPLELAALVYDSAQIDLPPGSYKFAARKGFEYEPVDMQVSIGTAPEQTVTLPLRKFADFEAQGWYPGDTHMHFPDPSGIRYEMECEGLRVCSLLIYKNGYARPPRPGEGVFLNVEHFTGKLSPVSDAEHFVKVGEEFRHGLLAHLIFQNLNQIVWPVSTGGLRESGAGGYDWPLMLGASDDARAQRALVTWAHWPYRESSQFHDFLLRCVPDV